MAPLICFKLTHLGKSNLLTVTIFLPYQKYFATSMYDAFESITVEKNWNVSSSNEFENGKKFEFSRPFSTLVLMILSLISLDKNRNIWKNRSSLRSLRIYDFETNRKLAIFLFWASKIYLGCYPDSSSL